MKNPIQSLIDQDEKISIFLEGIFDKFSDELKSSEFPLLAKLIFQIVKRINEIKEGIIDCCFADHYYSSQILYRTLIEHFIFFLYIQRRFSNDSNESIANEYYTNRKWEEELDFWESHIKKLKLLQREDLIDDMRNNIYNIRFPYLSKVSKKKLGSLNLHFKVKQIIDFMVKSVDFEKMDENTDIPELNLLDYITDFVQLSSFVHAGPIAEEFMEKYSDDDKRNEKLIEVSKSSFILANGVKDLALIMFLSITKNINYLNKSDTLRKMYVKYPGTI